MFLDKPHLKKNAKRISNDLINGLPTQTGDEITNGTQKVDEENLDAMEVDENLANDSTNESTDVGGTSTLTKPSRKKIFKDMRHGVNSTLINNLNADLFALNDRFLEITTPSLNDPSAYVDYGDKLPNPEDFMEGLENYEQQWTDFQLRRVGVFIILFLKKFNF